MLWEEVARAEPVVRALEPWPDIRAFLQAWAARDPLRKLMVGPGLRDCHEFEVGCIYSAAAALATGQTRVALSISIARDTIMGGLLLQAFGFAEGPPEHEQQAALLGLLTALAPQVTVLRLMGSDWPDGLPKVWLAPFAGVRHLVVSAPVDVGFLEVLHAAETIEIDGYALQPAGTRFEHMQRLIDGGWLRGVAGCLVSLRAKGIGIAAFPVPLPRLQEFSAAWLPQGSLARLTPALQRLYLSCRPLPDLPPAPHLELPLHLPRSLRLLSVLHPDAVGDLQARPSPLIPPLLAAAADNLPQGALESLSIQVGTLEAAADVASQVLSCFGNGLRHLRTLSISPRPDHGVPHSDRLLSWHPVAAVVHCLEPLRRLLARPMPQLHTAHLLSPASFLPAAAFPSLAHLGLYMQPGGPPISLSAIADAAPKLRTLHLREVVHDGGYAELGRRCGYLERIDVHAENDGRPTSAAMWAEGTPSEAKVSEASQTLADAALRLRQADATSRSAWLAFVSGLGGITVRHRRASAALAVPWWWPSLGGRVADMLGCAEPSPTLMIVPELWGVRIERRSVRDADRET
jgi:hypothetical protein